MIHAKQLITTAKNSLNIVYVFTILTQSAAGAGKAIGAGYYLFSKGEDFDAYYRIAGPFVIIMGIAFCYFCRQFLRSASTLQKIFLAGFIYFYVLTLSLFQFSIGFELCATRGQDFLFPEFLGMGVIITTCLLVSYLWNHTHTRFKRGGKGNKDEKTAS